MQVVTEKQMIDLAIRLVKQQKLRITNRIPIGDLTKLRSGISGEEAEQIFLRHISKIEYVEYVVWIHLDNKLSEKMRNLDLKEWITPVDKHELNQLDETARTFVNRQISEIEVKIPEETQMKIKKHKYVFPLETREILLQKHMIQSEYLEYVVWYWLLWELQKVKIE